MSQIGKMRMRGELELSEELPALFSYESTLLFCKFRIKRFNERRIRIRTPTIYPGVTA